MHRVQSQAGTEAGSINLFDNTLWPGQQDQIIQVKIQNQKR
jgi:hypothetical protein